MASATVAAPASQPTAQSLPVSHHREIGVSHRQLKK
jgi:hypothetical protein